MFKAFESPWDNVCPYHLPFVTNATPKQGEVWRIHTGGLQPSFPDRAFCTLMYVSLQHDRMCVCFLMKQKCCGASGDRIMTIPYGGSYFPVLLNKQDDHSLISAPHYPKTVISDLTERRSLLTSVSLKVHSSTPCMGTHHSGSCFFHVSMEDGSLNIYLYSTKSQQKSSQGTLHIEQV